jgi:drug/metabolite transporter (DMT)-like permease|tara:strand:+ start:691 stop:1563 length:873 start_codon:yes stop_codon:yes gene_type:complete
MNQPKIIPLLFIGLLSISTSPIVAKSLASSGTIIAFWRMLLASFFLWSYSLLYFKNLKGLSYSNKIRTSLAGILLGIHFIFFFEAIKITTIANATFLGTLAPFFTLIIELVLFKRHYKKIVYIGLLISLIGTLFVLTNNFDLSSRFTIGNIYAILCSLAISISFLIAEKVRDTEGTIEYTRMLYGIAALTIFIIGSFYTQTFIIIEKTEVVGFVFLALIPTILGHNIFYYCLKFTTPTIVGTIPLGEPIIASIIAFFLFNELISLNTAIGGALCMYGIFLILKNRSIPDV